MALAEVSVVLTEGHNGVLRAGTLRVPAHLGRGGVRRDKREGDGATPIGRFPLRRVFYRPDRLAAPTTILPVSAVTANAGWCDDPTCMDYNRVVALPHPGRHERLWRDDALYDLIVVVGYNDNPVEPGLGSAIFMHLARPDGGPTEGCIALAPGDLLAVLENCDPDTILAIA